MNERIKELIEQAGFAPWVTEATTDVILTRELEKFAELIVQECLLAISKTTVADNEITTMVKCHDQVAEHFGVER